MIDQIRIEVCVKFDIDEISKTLSPAQMRAVFLGMADVLAATKGIAKEKKP